MSGLNRILFFILLSSLPVAMTAQQVTARVAGLEGNAKYMALLTQEQQLHRAEDSVVRIINETRKLFSGNPSQGDREKYGAEILRLEKELFDVRSQKGVTTNQIDAIEQEFIVSNLNNPQPVPTPAAIAPTAGQLANLVYNNYFPENLSKHDYESLLAAQRKEALPAQLIATYLSNYRKIDSLASRYDTVGDRLAAADLYSKLQAVGSLNKAVEDSLSNVWGYIYDNKVYAYNYLLDKMGKSELLGEFEARFRKNRQQIASVRDSVMSEVMYGYPLQKRQVLSYEETLAGLLGYTAARDSVNRQAGLMKNISYALPKINPQERIFIQYADIQRTTPSVYNAGNPIPVNETNQKGTVYRVQLGAFQQKQPVSIFKGVSPLCCDKTDEGRYRYCAGAFRELSEARTALAKLKEMGFRKPEIVVWRDGVFEMIGGELSGETAASSVESLFRVEIAGQGERLGEMISEVIEAKAPGKETARIATEQGTFLYSIGNFDSRESADVLCEAVNGVSPGSATVLLVEN